MIANNTTKSAKKQKVWNNKVENTENHLRQLSCHFWRKTKKTFPRKSSFETIIASLDEQLKSAFVCNIILSCKTSLKVKSFELKEITNFETEKVTRCEKLKSYFFLLFALKMFRRQCKQTHFFCFENVSGQISEGTLFSAKLEMIRSERRFCLLVRERQTNVWYQSKFISYYRFDI